MLVGWKGPSSDPKIASFRYRVRTPARALTKRGHDVEVFDPARADDYGQVVFCKSYGESDRGLARRVRERGGRVVFDLCDNHLYNPLDAPRYRAAGAEIGAMAALADQVVCSSRALARVVGEAYGLAEVRYVPDAVEVHAVGSEPAPGPLRVLWFGSHGSPNAPAGMTDLLLIRPELEALARRRPLVLTVCSNDRAKYEAHIEPLPFPTRYVEWTLDGFGPVLAAADLVVLPTSVNPFTACKTHNRLTTALYAGVPVVATGVESYREFAAFCTLDDWPGGLARAAGDNAGERARAAAARDVLDRFWTIDAIAPLWEQALALPMGRQPAVTPARRGRALRLHGRLDAVAVHAVTGWVFAPSDAGAALTVVLELDGHAVARTAVDLDRPDLKAAGLPPGCGFSLTLPAELRPRTAVAVRVEETGWTFPDQPILLAAGGVVAAASAAPAGLHVPPSARADVRAGLARSLRRRRRRLEALAVRRDEGGRARGAAALDLVTTTAQDEADTAPEAVDRARMISA